MAGRFSTLADWLAWQESHHPSAIDLGLDRVREVASRMGILTPEARVFTVAGTNGKGSCVATLEALLLAAGKKVGAYSSPHFLRYNERIRLQGEIATDAELCDSFDRIDQARGDISLTYFEFGTLAAIDIFYRAELDYWVLEVGLGGRLDAVNIIDPDVAVITSIAIDHEAWLGTDRETIGREKAGICRLNKPCVCADANPPDSVIATIKDLNCDSYWWQQSFGYTGGGQFFIGDYQLQVPMVQLPAPSVASALQVLHLEGILGAELPLEAAQNCVAQVQLTGRMQRLQRGQQLFVLDVAHNPAACELLAANIASQSFEQPLVAVIAVMSDKDMRGMFEPLRAIIGHWWCCDLADNPRAASSAQLKEQLLALAVESSKINQACDVASALAAIASANKAATVIVFGSFFTVAAALNVLQ